MNIEEKLQHFYETTISEAQRDARTQLQEHKYRLEKELEEHKEKKRQETEAAVKAEAEHARREVNKALSKEHLTLKQKWNKAQGELKEELFSEVKQQLEAYMSTPEYEDYLCRQIQEAKAFAGEDEIIICLSSGDASRLDSLTARTGVPLQVSQDDFLGGIQATIPDKNILIDNSFLEKFLSLRKEFTFEGGRTHE